MTGKYTVAANCTGTTEHNFPEALGIPPGSGKLAIADSGREVYIVADPPAPMQPSTTMFIYKRQWPAYSGTRGLDPPRAE